MDRTPVRILDLGGTVEYWHRVGIEFLRNASVHVTVLNYVASEAQRGDASDQTMFATAVGDACDLAQFADGSFDLVHSNSVVEHVGNWSRMKSFAAETRRVGRSYYVQTPYFWFPIDPHYYGAPMIHWMPRPWQARILKAFPVAHCGRSTSLDNSYD
ncbi:MAG: class I SAM-dependent methyltransferase, partial [Phenylobacterium sp.]